MLGSASGRLPYPVVSILRILIYIISIEGLWISKGLAGGGAIQPAQVRDFGNCWNPSLVVKANQAAKTTCAQLRAAKARLLIPRPTSRGHGRLCHGRSQQTTSSQLKLRSHSSCGILQKACKWSHINSRSKGRGLSSRADFWSD